MTDNEIIKALECCTDESYENCNECPYSTDTLSCERLKLLEDSLDLINSLKAEVERLKECPKCVYEYDGEVIEYCIQGPCLNFKPVYVSADLAIKQIKNEAYKEFAERLNEEAQIADCFDSYNMVVGTHFIDNLLKEMVGEE